MKDKKSIGMGKAVFLLLFGWIVVLQAAFELQCVNSEIMATGGITSLHPFGCNPGVFDTGPKFLVATNYTNLFGIKELHCWDCNIRYIFLENNSLTIKSNSVGNDLYQENTYQLGFARRLTIPVSIGISVAYYDLNIKEYLSENAIGLNLGICYYINEKVKATSLFGNVNRPKICNNNELLPEYFAFGWCWQIHDRIEVSTELFKDTIYPFNTRFGIDLKVCEYINLYSGLQTNPDRFSGGISINFLNIQFTSSMQNHLNLPNTYYFGCTFHLK
jgi:hypothetical protein